jgi:polyisoprenyl-teichoic acid--peptidoglycan teichoic acid transferase
MTTPSPFGRRQLDGPVRRTQPSTVDAVKPLPEPEVEVIHQDPEPVLIYTKPKRRFRFTKKKVIFGVLAIIFLVGGYIGAKAFMATNRIITKSHGTAPGLSSNNVSVTQLRGEGAGRVNILLLGVGGPGHDGPNLSDTIMVMSIDPKTKDVAMLSIPRDLYVKIPGHGTGKINGANSYGGPELAQKVVSNIIGVPIHYYLQVDFAGFKQAVDAVNGIDVTVAKTLSDPLYPCDSTSSKKYRYCPIYFKAGVHHFNGKQALEYSRSRETTSDFDRAARQQQVIVALRQKALDLSTLTNPIKLGNLIDALGNHVKTDMQLSDMKKLAVIAKDIDPTKITQRVLSTAPDGLLIENGPTVPSGFGYIEVPAAGTFNYTEIKDLVKNIFTDRYITDENARIEVQNGSGITGLAGIVVKSLKSAHYNVGEPLNAPQNVTKTVIYDYSGGKKPYTINYLEQRFGVKAQKVTAPVMADGTTPPEIRIIIGSDYKLPTSSTAINSPS